MYIELSTLSHFQKVFTGLK